MVGFVIYCVLILLRISHYDSFLWTWRAFHVNEWIIITIMQMLLLLPFAKWPGLLVGRFVYISKLSITIFRLNVSKAKFFQLSKFFHEVISFPEELLKLERWKKKYLLESQNFLSKYLLFTFILLPIQGRKPGPWKKFLILEKNCL